MYSIFINVKTGSATRGRHAHAVDVFLYILPILRQNFYYLHGTTIPYWKSRSFSSRFLVGLIIHGQTESYFSAGGRFDLKCLKRDYVYW